MDKMNKFQTKARIDNKKLRSREAQTFIEYTILIGIVAMAFFVLEPLIKRGLQGMIKVVSDQVGNQEEGDQAFDDTGHLESSYLTVESRVKKDTRESFGTTTYSFNDKTVQMTNALINLGFTEGNN
ncbi:MAG: hypothetical protein A2Y04_04955 [Omnitrophica WOR_2 bacterium GWC2_45_7]|nr:MAG: hypothetical protein A2Y04_04955 [Omnitrophica WOR_2 bacterium GWC2_45_7]